MKYEYVKAILKVGMILETTRSPKPNTISDRLKITAIGNQKFLALTIDGDELSYEIGALDSYREANEGIKPDDFMRKR